MLHSRPPLERMLRIHQAVQSGKFPNATRLAAELEVSTKSIHRDIEFMRDRLELPLEYHPQRFGYHYTTEVTSFPTMHITEGELVALVIAEKALEQYRGTQFEKPLLSAIRKIEPWGPTTNYSTAGWQRLANASELLRATPPALTEKVLAGLCTGPNAAENQLKCFLLLRFAFELPENGSAGDRAPSRPQLAAPGETNADGSLNLAWPMVWNGGRPRLVAGSTGALDPGYSPAQDYTFLRYKTRFRDLASFQP